MVNKAFSCQRLVYAFRFNSRVLRTGYKTGTVSQKPDSSVDIIVYYLRANGLSENYRNNTN